MASTTIPVSVSLALQEAIVSIASMSATQTLVIMVVLAVTMLGSSLVTASMATQESVVKA